METKISIKLKVNDVTIELTVDEAKRLADTLNELVGKKEKEYIPYPAYPTYPTYPYRWAPYWTWHTTDNCTTGVYSLNPNIQVTYTSNIKDL